MQLNEESQSSARALISKSRSPSQIENVITFRHTRARSEEIADHGLCHHDGSPGVHVHYITITGCLTFLLCCICVFPYQWLDGEFMDGRALLDELSLFAGCHASSLTSGGEARIEAMRSDLSLLMAYKPYDGSDSYHPWDRAEFVLWWVSIIFAPAMMAGFFGVGGYLLSYISSINAYFTARDKEKAWNLSYPRDEKKRERENGKDGEEG